MKGKLFLLLAFAAAVCGCKQKVSDSKPVAEYAGEIITGKNVPVENFLKAFNPRNPEGDIVVFGPAEDVLEMSGYLKTVDIFDNVDGRIAADGLPDFCGETISRVVAYPDSLKDDADHMAERSRIVRTAVALMDTVALRSDAYSKTRRNAGKLIVFTSPDVTEYAKYDLDSLFRALNVESPVVYPDSTMELTAMKCYRELRRRNAFTHRISYPKLKNYVALPNSEGVYMIIDSNERFIQD